jgi:CTP:molybdopterin cytidylyltransferase MocA
MDGVKLGSNPAGLRPRHYFLQPLQLEGDAGAERRIAAHRQEVRQVEVATAGIFADVDTPETLAQMRQR